MDEIVKAELLRVCELTGARPEHIKLHTDGFWTRAYVVNNGEFVVKYNKREFEPVHGEPCDHEKEARVLNRLSKLDLPVNTQKVIMLNQDEGFLALQGVVGTPLSEIENLTPAQKQNIGEKLGAFIKQLHTVEMDSKGRSLEDLLIEYEGIYDGLQPFFQKNLSQREQEVLNGLIYDRLPNGRRELGEKKVFSHTDLFDRHVIINGDEVGVIDTANAGYCDEATDFVSDHPEIRSASLDTYGADEGLRRKVQLGHDMSIVSAPSFYIPVKGEEAATKLWIPRIRDVISKYEDDKTL